MNPADIKNVTTLSEVVAKYIELKPSGKEHWGCCPFHGERTPSFQVQDYRRSWHCYGCGKHGDVIDFVQAMEKCEIGTACDIIRGSSGYSVAARQELPPIVDHYAGLVSVQATETDLPVAGEWIRIWNPKPSESFPHGKFTNYRPNLIHPYRLRDDTIVGCTVRINLPDKKIVPMLRMIEKDGNRCWSHFPFPKPRSLYKLETLKDTAEEVVLIVEGEKCADIARHVLGGMVLTWSGGTNAAKFTDWSPLKDKNVLLWPDADPEGEAAMQGVAEMVAAAGAREVKSIAVDMTRGKGWDIGDAVQRNKMSRAEIFAWMKGRIVSCSTGEVT